MNNKFVHSGDNLFTKEGITVAKIDNNPYILNDQFSQTIKINNIVPYFEHCYRITTTSGTVTLPKTSIIPNITYGDFHKVYGYDKKIINTRVDQLEEGNILITPFLFKTEQSENTPLYIDIFDVVLNHVNDNFDGYIVKCEDEDVVIYSTNGKKMVPYKRYQPAKSLLNIMAWYITEGWSSKQFLKNPSASKFLSSFTQSIYKNMENTENICEDLKNLGIPISISKHQKYFNNAPLEVTYQFNSCISVLMQTCGWRSDEKKIPDWIMGFLISNPSYINEFVATLIEGDGHYDPISNIYSYSSKSFELIKQITFLIRLLGMYVKYSKQKSQHVIAFGSKNRKIGLVRFKNFAMTKILNIEDTGEQECLELILDKPGNIFVGSLGNIMI